MCHQLNTTSGLPKYWKLERRTVEKAAASEPAKKFSPPVLLLAVAGRAERAGPVP